MIQILLFPVWTFIVGYFVYGQVFINSTMLLYPDNSRTITISTNDKIKTAYYHPVASKYDFKMIERGYTKFISLIVSPKLKAKFEGAFTLDSTLISLEKC
jgi:hypothetical protein